jgi:hypothetical protein
MCVFVCAVRYIGRQPLPLQGHAGPSCAKVYFLYKTASNSNTDFPFVCEHRRDHLLRWHSKRLSRFQLAGLVAKECQMNFLSSQQKCVVYVHAGIAKSVHAYTMRRA